VVSACMREESETATREQPKLGLESLAHHLGPRARGDLDRARLHVDGVRVA
jgi:hypothetical protein